MSNIPKKSLLNLVSLLALFTALFVFQRIVTSPSTSTTEVSETKEGKEDKTVVELDEKPVNTSTNSIPVSEVAQPEVPAPEEKPAPPLQIAAPSEPPKEEAAKKVVPQRIYPKVVVKKVSRSPKQQVNEAIEFDDLDAEESRQRYLQMNQLGISSGGTSTTPTRGEYIPFESRTSESIAFKERHQ